MATRALENLVKIGKLKQEPPDQAEFDGMVTALNTDIWYFNVCNIL